jgi:hypothetical protein
MYSKIITEDKKVCIFDHNKRDDNELIEVISRLGSNANGAHAKLKIVEIPDDVEYFIEDHDGIERIVEKHRHWE